MNAVAVPLNESNSSKTGSKLNRFLVWLGWAISLIPVYVVGTSAHWKLTHNPGYLKMFDQIGWNPDSLTLLACLQLGAIVLYIIPPTSIFGAIILTGYLGGAIASYTRIHDYFPVVVPLGTAIFAWLGIWLRDPHFRRLCPIRFHLFKK